MTESLVIHRRFLAVVARAKAAPAAPVFPRAHWPARRVSAAVWLAARDARERKLEQRKKKA